MKFNKCRSFFESDKCKKVGAFVFALALTLSFSFVRPVEAEAVAGTSAVALGAAASQVYFTATGIPLTVISGGASAGTAAISSAASAYATATGAAASGEAVLSGIAAGATISSAGTLILTAAGAAALGAFAIWAYNHYFNSVPSSEPVVFYSSSSYSIGDFTYGSGRYRSNGRFEMDSISPGTAFTHVGDSVRLSESRSLVLTQKSGYYCFMVVDNDGIVIRSRNGGSYFYVGPDTVGEIANVEISAAHPIYILAINSTSSSSSPSFDGNFVRGVYYMDDMYYFTQNMPFSGGSIWQVNYPSVQMLSQIGSQFDSADVVVNNVNISAPSGYIAPPSVSSGGTLEIPAPPALDGSTWSETIADAVGNNTLQVGTPTVVEPVPPPTIIIPPDVGFNPDLPDSGEPTEPSNPGTDSPFLPGNLDIPWHYVSSTIGYALAFIPVAIAAFTNFLPTSCQIVIWAAVVLAVLFGLFRRFLG